MTQAEENTLLFIGQSKHFVRELATSLIIALLTFEKYFSLDRSTIFTGSGPSTL